MIHTTHNAITNHTFVANRVISITSPRLVETLKRFTEIWAITVVFDNKSAIDIGFEFKDLGDRDRKTFMDMITREHIRLLAAVNKATQHN